VVAPLTERASLEDRAGNTTGTWPGGTSVASPHPSTVHSEQITFSTTYSAVDPSTKVGGPVAVDGFWGWTEASKAS